MEIAGRAVVLTDGKAGTVEKVWLDEFHGLRISIKGHDGKWPVSTIKRARTRPFARTTSSLRLGKLILSEVNRLTFFEDAPFF